MGRVVVGKPVGLRREMGGLESTVSLPWPQVPTPLPSPSVFHLPWPAYNFDMPGIAATGPLHWLGSETPFHLTGFCSGSAFPETLWPWHNRDTDQQLLPPPYLGLCLEPLPVSYTEPEH